MFPTGTRFLGLSWWSKAGADMGQQSAGMPKSQDHCTKQQQSLHALT